VHGKGAAQERIALGTYETLVFGVVGGEKSTVVAFGKVDTGEAPRIQGILHSFAVRFDTMSPTLSRASSPGISFRHSQITGAAVQLAVQKAKQRMS